MPKPNAFLVTSQLFFFHNSFLTEHRLTAFSVIVLFFKFTEATNYILTFSFDFAEQYVYVDIFIKDFICNREAITSTGYQHTRFSF